MAYILNGIDLATYGIIPGRTAGSNIALSGAWDMPSRKNKVSHDWGDQNGVEAYVNAPEIFFGGRDLTLAGQIIQADKAAVETKLKGFYTGLAAIAGLTTLATPWGSFQVYVKDVIEVTYLKAGIATIIIKFREPVVDLTGGTLPASTASLLGIDGISFADLGIVPLLHTGGLSLPAMKRQYFSEYEKEGYQIAKTASREFTLNALLKDVNYAGFNNKIKALYKLFSQPGLRTINVQGDEQRTVFMQAGWAVSKMTIKPNLVAAKVELKLTNAD